MKKIIIALVLGMTLTSVAQQTPTKLNTDALEKMTPEQRQQRQMQHLTRKLDLDAKQQVEVSKILTDAKVEFRDLKNERAALKAESKKMSKEEKAAFKNKVANEKNDVDTKMKAVLNPEQYQKWILMKEANKEKRMEKREMTKKASE